MLRSAAPRLRVNRRALGSWFPVPDSQGASLTFGDTRGGFPTVSSRRRVRSARVIPPDRAERASVGIALPAAMPPGSRGGTSAWGGAPRSRHSPGLRPGSCGMTAAAAPARHPMSRTHLGSCSLPRRSSPLRTFHVPPDAPGLSRPAWGSTVARLGHEPLVRSSHEPHGPWRTRSCSSTASRSWPTGRSRRRRGRAAGSRCWPCSRSAASAGCRARPFRPTCGRRARPTTPVVRSTSCSRPPGATSGGMRCWLARAACG